MSKKADANTQLMTTNIQELKQELNTKLDGVREEMGVFKEEMGVFKEEVRTDLRKIEEKMDKNLEEMRKDISTVKEDMDLFKTELRNTVQDMRVELKEELGEELKEAVKEIRRELKEETTKELGNLHGKMEKQEQEMRGLHEKINDLVETQGSQVEPIMMELKQIRERQEGLEKTKNKFKEKCMEGMNGLKETLGNQKKEQGEIEKEMKKLKVEHHNKYRWIAEEMKRHREEIMVRMEAIEERIQKEKLGQDETMKSEVNAVKKDLINITEKITTLVENSPQNREILTMVQGEVERRDKEIMAKIFIDRQEIIKAVKSAEERMESVSEENKDQLQSRVEEMLEEKMQNKLKNEIEEILEDRVQQLLRSKMEQLEKMQEELNSKLIIGEDGNIEVKNNNERKFLVDYDPNNDKCHAMYFLHNAHKYTELSRESWEVKLLNIVSHLKGEADDWARLCITDAKDFDEFSRKFKNKYWSRGEQDKFENRLMAGGEYKTGKQSLANYILNYYKITTYLDREYDFDMFRKYIGKHFSSNIAAAIAASSNVQNEEDLQRMIESLESLEEMNIKNMSSDYTNEGHVRQDYRGPNNRVQNNEQYKGRPTNRNARSHNNRRDYYY